VSPSAKATPTRCTRYRSNLQGEIDGAAIYAALAESEANRKLVEVCRCLATAEGVHGDSCASNPRRGRPVPRDHPQTVHRILCGGSNRILIGHVAIMWTFMTLSFA
jgi:hypothetical protein